MPSDIGMKKLCLSFLGFLDTGSFAFEVAEIVDTRSANFTFLVNFDGVNVW